ncbi:uncharacterized protein LOC126557452 [Anopheles maculipalpis]|uniref:uncharacterized protein LOC126557452 n=1 Tax=Anopheles maculipalpis TaxID=1496333 RepID=UPI0021597290|nr:uncharacterized protein LOC126557452 [Anopheles maculipalpis]
MAGETNTDSSVEQATVSTVAPTETSAKHVSSTVDLRDSQSHDVIEAAVQEETMAEESVKQISIVEQSATVPENEKHQELSVNAEEASLEVAKVVEQNEPVVQLSENSVMEPVHDVSIADEEDNTEAFVSEKRSTETVEDEDASAEPVVVKEEISAEPVAAEEVSTEPAAVKEEISPEPIAVKEEISPEPIAVKEEISAEPFAIEEITTEPAFLYKAMEQVASGQGFTAGQFKIEFDVGSNKGDGFVGQLFKAFLTEGDRREVFLCKIPPLNEARRRQFPTMTIFSRETLAYKTLLPALFTYQESKGVAREDGFFNVPKCYYAECDETAEESVIIMEDLRLQDYRMWDKMVPVNYEHVKLTMQSLGRLHAVSLALKRERPQDFEQFKVSDPLEVLMPEGSPMAGMMVQMILDAIETLEPHETKERSKLQKLADNMRKEMLACTDSSSAEPYTVLGHGDCWVNNFMFNYKNGIPENVVLLDWQITRYVSPVLDLVYFLFCCTDEEFRRRHYDEMMNVYYNSLETLLEKLGHSPQEVFPRTALMRQLRRYGKFGILMAVFLVPMLCTRNEDLIDMDEAAERYRDTNEMDLKGVTMNANKQAYRTRMSAVARDLVRYGYL